MHESIVDRAVWEKIQQKRGKARKRVTNEGERNVLGCGLRRLRSLISLPFQPKGTPISVFQLFQLQGERGTCNATTTSALDFLEQVVLGEIRRLTRFASNMKPSFQGGDGSLPAAVINGLNSKRAS